MSSPVSLSGVSPLQQPGGDAPASSSSPHPASTVEPQFSTAARVAESAVTLQAATLAKTKLRKKRSDAPRSSTAAGAGGSNGNSLGSSSNGRSSKRQQAVSQLLPHQQPQSIYRRLARARWAACMFLPPLLLLLHRTDRVEKETNGNFNTMYIIAFFALLAMINATNELIGSRRSHVVAYVSVFSFSLLWGAVIVALRDLTAARFLCMIWFGVCCGSLRYHWADAPSQQHQHQQQSAGGSTTPPSLVHHHRSSSKQQFPFPTVDKPLPTRGGAGASSTALAAPPLSTTASDGLSSESPSTATAVRLHSPVVPAPLPSEASVHDTDDTSLLSSEGYQHKHLRQRQAPPQQPAAAPTAAPVVGDEEQADYFFLLSQQNQKWSYFWKRTVEYLQTAVMRKASLCLCASVGEVVACAVFVPNSWGDIIAVSWLGYAAMLVLPVVIFKSASWVSHALILICGSRVNTADASRMLFCYWLTTTVLSLGTLMITMFWIVTSLVPYVWGLQVLMMPYAVACEWIALESREYQATNPYREVAEVYREHIDATMQNSKEYFLH